MTNQTLGQMLKAEFGGQVELEWGTPADKNLRADLIQVRKNPGAEKVYQVLTSYFNSYGFKRIGTRTPPGFEDDAHKNQWICCYTYHPQLEKMIVSAAEF